MIENSQDSQYEKEVNPARLMSVKILNRLERSGSYIDKLVDYELNSNNLSDLDKALLKELVYGVTRWKAKLDWVLIGFFHGDFQKCFNYVKNALRIGLYQILYLDKVPNSAAIDEAVEIVKRKQGKKTAGLINGVLRNIARNIENIRFPKENDDRAFYISIMESHPKWMVSKWIERFGEEEALALLRKNNEISQQTIKINPFKITREEIFKLFEEHKVEYQESKFLEGSIKILTQKVKMHKTELFKDGKITIQDTSASLAAKLLTAKENENILDMCAAPGGKTSQIIEDMNDKGKVTAVDLFEARVKLIEENIKRLGYKSIEVEAADLRTYNTEVLFDGIQLDVPCSGLGTISKKPDIKWSFEKESIAKLHKIQLEFLTLSSKLVKVGGRIVYSTCTIEKEENENVINEFLKENTNFELDKAEKYIHPEVCRDGMMMTFPHIHNIDGAFAARLVRKS